jgi:RNA polymerase sigma-70 factor, ECF subfamily
MTYRDDLRRHLRAALEGDPRAIERVLADVRPIIARYCRARLGGPRRSAGRSAGRSYAAADRVAQEACLAVLSRLADYPEQSRPFLGFVYDIAAEMVARAGGPPSNHPLDSLPATQRDVVILRTLVGLSTEETAEAVGMSPAVVRLTQHRALGRLRGRII